jgi:hypothetical protein
MWVNDEESDYFFISCPLFKKLLGPIVVKVDSEAISGSHAVREDEIFEEGEVDETLRMFGLQTALVINPYPGKTSMFSPDYLITIVDRNMAHCLRPTLFYYLFVTSRYL